MIDYRVNFYEVSMILSFKKFKFQPLILALVIFVSLSCVGCAKKVEIPNAGTALDQFYYAMETFYFPSEKAVNEKDKKNLARQAADALETVWTYFPPKKPSLVHMEARYYQGRCYQFLGENEKAVESYYACFTTEVTGGVINDYEADMVSYKSEAWYALMELRQLLSPEELRSVDLFRPEP